MTLKKKDLIFLLLIFILFYKVFFKTEKMTDDSNNIKIMKDLIDANYSIDVDAIRNLSTVANDLISNDQLKIPSNLNVVGSVNFLPKGTIVAWNGSKVPQGWALCDGKNNTPDLRGRFILGSGSNWKGSGGSSTKNIQLVNMPKHNHGGYTIGSGYHNHSFSDNHRLVSVDSYTHRASSRGGGQYNALDMGNSNQLKNLSDITTNEDGYHRHSIKSDGSSQPMDIMPPYYVLAWIMRTI